MIRIAAILAVAVSLAACDMFSTLIDGWKYAKAVEADLAVSTGMKPQVGFNWHNGRLVRVTVTFPRLYEAKPLREVAEIVRRSVASNSSKRPTISIWRSRSAERARAPRRNCAGWISAAAALTIAKFKGGPPCRSGKDC